MHKQHFFLDPEVTFLNHGSYGACPKPVFEVYQQWQLEIEREPVNFFGRRAFDLLAESRTALGEYLNADPDDLTFVVNATAGINTVARYLRLGPDDEILTTDHEYGSIDITWDHFTQWMGSKIVRHKIPLPVTTKEAMVDALWESVTPRTRIIALSHITAPTALVFPVEEICKRAREAGIITVIDGAHAPGQVPVDLGAMQPDFYTGNCHKWLSAPKGSAFLYVHKDHQSDIRPLIIGHGSRDNTIDFVTRHQWQGTRDISAYLSIPAAIRFQEEHDWDDVRRQCHDLALEIRRRVNALTGLESIAPEDWFGQMISIRLPERELTDYASLWHEYKVEVPVLRWHDETLMRVSIQGYNTHQDADMLLGALEKIIAS